MQLTKLILALLLAALALPAAKTMQIYFIDVEGGQSTLIVGPSGQAMLFDAGYAGFSGRDADRIKLAAKNAGVKKLEALLVSHFHSDHMGGVPNVLQRLPAAVILDHGETIGPFDRDWENYKAVREKNQHKVLTPGDKIAIKGLDITVLAGAGKTIQRPGEANPFCAGLRAPDAVLPTGPAENAKSLGIVVQFGKFRFVDLGDLFPEREYELLCPQNRVGKTDLYITTHHGAEQTKALHAMAPRVAIMNNGAKKGGTPAGWQQIKASPGLEDLWQLHFSVAGGKENNVADTFIANLDDACEGKYIKITATADGAFTVYNSRNKHTKVYPAR
jgi:beta-lactamase superfamily II metal-dependent hydrolase